MTAYEWMTAFMEVAGAGHIGHMWQCPAHRDSFPSLSINQGEGGIVLVKCHAVCETEAVIQALGLSTPRLFEPHHLPPAQVHSMLLTPPTFDAMTLRAGSGHHRGQSIGTPETHIYAPGSYRLVRFRCADGSKRCSWE